METRYIVADMRSIDLGVIMTIGTVVETKAEADELRDRYREIHTGPGWDYRTIELTIPPKEA